MTDRPANYPDFATAPAPADIAAPGAGRVSSGWLTNDIPPHDEFNYLQQLYGLWARYLDESLPWALFANSRLLEGLAETLVAGGDWTHDAGSVVVGGSRLTVAAGVVNGMPDGTNYAYVDGAGAVQHTTNPLDLDGNIPLAQIEVAGGVITGTIDIRTAYGDVYGNAILTVGPAALGAHFPSLKDALAAVKFFGLGNNHRIRLLATVVEPAAITDADIGPGEVLIEGSGADNSSDGPWLRWSFAGPLFDLSGGSADGMTFRGVGFDATAAAASGDAVVNVSASGGMSRWTFEGCQVAGASGLLYVDPAAASPGISDVTVDRCQIGGTDFAIWIPAAAGASVDRLRVVGSSFDRAGSALGTSVDGFRVASASATDRDQVIIKDCQINDALDAGIVLECSGSVVDTEIHNTGGGAGATHAIKLAPGAGQRASARGCTVDGVLGGIVSVVELGARSTLEACHIRAPGAVALPLVAATGDHVIIGNNRLDASGQTTAVIAHSGAQGSVVGNVIYNNAATNAFDGTGGDFRALTGNVWGGGAVVASAGDVVGNNVA